MTKQRERSTGRRRGAARPAALAAAKGGRSELLGLALAEAAAGRLPQAEAALRQILGRDSGNADARYHLGLVFSRQKRWEEAVLAFQAVIAQQPKHAEAHYQKGLALAEMRRLAEAEFALRDALASQPWFPAALLGLARVQEWLDEAEAATESLRRAVEQDPRFAEAHFQLGRMLQGLGRLVEAVGSYSKTIELEPTHADAHNNLGLVYKALGRFDEAIGALRRALELRPNFDLALCNLGNALWDAGRLDEAVEAYRTCIAAHPRYVHPYVNIANIRRKQGNLKEAAEYARRALAVNSNEAAAHAALADVHFARAEYDHAIAAFRRALERQPRDPKLLYGLGNCHGKRGQLAEAISLYRRAIEINPRYAVAHNRLGLALQESGDLAGARDALQRAVEISPRWASGHSNLTRLIKYQEHDDHIRVMEALLNGADMATGERAALLFGLAKAFDDLGDYEKSFRYLHEANRLQRSLQDYDLQGDLDKASKMIEHMNPSFFDRQDVSGDSSDVPILVLGMPRSGTTLVEQILASHSQVHGAGEFLILQSMLFDWVQQIRSGSFPRRASEIAERDLRERGTRYLAALRTHSSSARHITDKSPLNFLSIGLIKLILPNARIIHCMRHPVDACVSAYQQLFRKSLFFSYDLIELGLFHNSYRRLMEHWRDVLPGQMFEIQYEDLVADQAGKTRELLAYCGLPWEDNCLRFHETKRTVRTASVAQVREPMYGTSVARWRKYRPYIGPLLETLGIDPEDSASVR